MATVSTSASGRRALPIVPGYRRLLVPISESPAVSARLVETACTLAEHGASIIAVFIIEVSPLLPLDARMSDEEATAREALTRAEAIADVFGLRIRIDAVRTRDAARTIVELAEDEGSELVVIDAPRTQRIYRRSPAFGSTVLHVLAKAPCRVLVVADPA
jgi:nucleotide-binding universal stress UspA family protein